MAKHFVAPTTYFLQEGRENMEECLKVAFQAAVQHDIQKLVIFTAKGDGVRKAVELRGTQAEFASRELIAVTFPAGKTFTDSENKVFTVEMSDDDKKFLATNRVPLVRAHLPFDSIAPGVRGAAGQEMSRLGDVLNIFCGSMSLCVEAAVLACDAGFVEPGDHIISLTADTAILATAAPTRHMLSNMVVREVLCKPAIMTIKHREPAATLPDEPSQSVRELSSTDQKRLKE